MVVWKRRLKAVLTALGGIYGHCSHVMPAPTLSPLASVIKPSKTIEIHALTKKMEARGEVRYSGGCKVYDKLSLQWLHEE